MAARGRVQGFQATDSPLESARFARRVRRYELGTGDGSLMIDAIREERPDLAIVRIPTDRAELVTDLAALGGQFVLGDCRVVYTRDNVDRGRTAGNSSRGFRLRPSTSTDGPLLDVMVERIFAGYRTHYATNPQLASFPVTDGYKEWARAHMGDGERRCLIAELDGEPCAFTTVQVNAEAGVVVLNGVLPQHRGRGVYRDLLRATIDAFIDAGAGATVIATQIDNRAVQRVWVTEGFTLTTSQYTIHINFIH